MSPTKLHHSNRPLAARCALALLASTGLLLAACKGEPTPPTVLVGVDGGEWQVIDEMIADGELPNFAKIKREGAWGQLINPGRLNSPAVWTSIATGHFPRTHGILGHVFPYTEKGNVRPVTSELRLVPALWNVASHYGLRSVVAGYFVTHPPEEIEGIMVSPYVSVREKGAMVPADALSLDEPRYQELMEETGREKIWRQYFDWDGIDKDTASDAPPERIEDDPTNNIRLKNRTVRDEFLRRAAQDLISQDSDFFVVYYRVTDILSHSLWKFYDPDAFEDPPTARELELFGESIRQAYRFTDLALGDLLEAWQGEANIIIVSDHGFGRASRAKMDDPEHRNQFLTGDHRPTGIFLASGPDIQPGEIQGVSTMEIAPTLATMLGLPVAGDLPGRVVTELFRPDYFTEHPLKTVDSYADVSIARQDVTADVGNQEEEMNTLRGLGYVGEGATFDAGQVSSDYDFWGANRQVVIAHLAGEIVFYLMQGNIESARSVLELARDNRPGIEKRILTAVRQRHQKLQKRVPAGTIAAEPFEAFLSASVQTKPRSH